MKIKQLFCEHITYKIPMLEVTRGDYTTSIDVCPKCGKLITKHAKKE